MSKPTEHPAPTLPDKPDDEPGMAERFQRGLRKALSTPPKRGGKSRTKKPKSVATGRK